MSEKVEHTELRKLAEAATPGPLEARLCFGIPADCVDYGVISHATGKETCRVWAEDDARFIAAANPSTVLALLAERDRLREALKEAERAASTLVINSEYVGAQRILGLWRAALKGEREGIAPDPITGEGDARSLDIKRDWCIEAARREGDAEVGAGYHSLPEAVAALSSRQAVLEEAALEQCIDRLEAVQRHQDHGTRLPSVQSALSLARAALLRLRATTPPAEGETK